MRDDPSVARNSGARFNGNTELTREFLDLGYRAKSNGIERNAFSVTALNAEVQFALVGVIVVWPLATQRMGWVEPCTQRCRKKPVGAPEGACAAPDLP